MRIPIVSAVLFALVLIMDFGHAAAAQRHQAVTPLGTFGNWKAFTFRQGSQPVCYMTLETHRSAPHLKRGSDYLMITHRPGEGTRDVVSYASGYTFKPGSDVVAEAGGKSFDMFTQNGTAWSRDAATDRALAAAISRSAAIRFTGTPATGSGPVVDKIGLKGSMPAYRAIGKACGIAVGEAHKAEPSRVHKIHKKHKNSGP